MNLPRLILVNLPNRLTPRPHGHEHPPGRSELRDQFLWQMRRRRSDVNRVPPSRGRELRRTSFPPVLAVQLDRGRGRVEGGEGAGSASEVCAREVDEALQVVDPEDCSAGGDEVVEDGEEVAAAATCEAVGGDQLHELEVRRGRTDVEDVGARFQEREQTLHSVRVHVRCRDSGAEPWYSPVSSEDLMMPPNGAAHRSAEVRPGKRGVLRERSRRGRRL